MLLGLGAVAGLAMAAFGLAGSTSHSALPDNVVAEVNGGVILADDYERVIAGVASDRREPIDADERRRVLDRLIEEELLVQRALELDFARKDPRARGDLTQAVIAAVVDEANNVQPTDPDLKAFYEKYQSFFTPSGALRVRQIFCRAPTLDDVDATAARCTAAATRLRAGEDFTVVRQQLGDPELSPIPDTAPRPSLTPASG